MSEKSINEFLNYLKNVKNYSNKTIESYKKDLLNFKTVINKKQIDYQDIRDYLAFLYKQNYKKTTISRHLSSLRSYFHYQEKKYDIKNPMTFLKNPKKNQTLPNFLTYEEIDKLINEPDTKTNIGIRDACILECLYSTGCRVSELINIRLKDISVSNNSIRLFGKGSKERDVFYGSYLEKKLNAYLKVRKEMLKGKSHDYLFLNTKGNKIGDRDIRAMIEKMAKKSGILKQVSPHVLRHTFATHMLDSGADLKTVQELLGHSNLATTQIYTHISNEQLRRVYLNTHPRSKKKND